MRRFFNGASAGGDHGRGSGSITGGPGGAGVDAFNCPITTLVNRATGTISGGSGGNGSLTGGNGGAGVSNAGTITTLTNRGTISGGRGGGGGLVGGAGDAIYSTGSIGSVANSGQIIGNVRDRQPGERDRHWRNGQDVRELAGGTIMISAGNLTFSGGNTALGDNISVNGGAGTLTNMAALQIATLTPLTIRIAGNDGIEQITFS